MKLARPQASFSSDHPFCAGGRARQRVMECEEKAEELTIEANKKEIEILQGQIAVNTKEIEILQGQIAAKKKEIEDIEVLHGQVVAYQKEIEVLQCEMALKRI